MGRPARARLFLIAIVLLFIGTIFLFISGSLLLEERRYRQAVPTEGVITDKGLQRATAGTSTSYEVSYRFTQEDRTPGERTEATSVHVWERVEPGSPIALEYVAGDPSSVRAIRDAGEERFVVMGAMGLGALLVLAGVVLVVTTFVSIVRGGTREPAATGAGGSGRLVLPVASSSSGSFWPLALRSFGVWFGGIFLLCGLPFLAVGVFMFYEDWRFDHQARTAEAMVLTKEIGESSSGSGSRRSRSTTYEATYRFVVDRTTYEGRGKLSAGRWQSLVEREPVLVRFLPQRPSSSRIAGEGSEPVRWVFGLLGSIFTAIGGIAFVGAIRGARLEWRLRQHGVQAQGTVTGLRRRNLKINNVQQWHLEFEYRDYQGGRHEKKTNVPESEAVTWRVGDTGKVLYDSHAPDDAVWLGRDGSTEAGDGRFAGRH